MSGKSNISDRDRKAARDRMKSTGERYLTALNHVISDRVAAKDSMWERGLEMVREVLLKEDRLPLSKNEGERSAYEWLRSQREEFAEGTLTPERENRLDEMSPRWRDPERKDSFTSRWLTTNWGVLSERVAECVGFLEKNGRLPDKKSTDEDERRLGGWLSRKRYSEMSAGVGVPIPVQDYLDDHLPCWRGDVEPNDRGWIGLADYALSVRQRTGAHASPESDIVKERMVRLWLDSTRDRDKRGVLADRKIAYLDENYPDWRV